jgi:hypothetical protein
MNFILKAAMPGIPEYLNATTILGLPVTTFAIVVFISLIVFSALGFFWWNSRKLDQHKKESKGRVVCEFMPEHGGKVWRELCEVYKMEAKKVETKSRAVFFSDSFVKAPKGHSLDAYYLIPEHDYLEVWPLNARPAQQVILQKFYFVENDPCPKMPHDPSRWDADRYTRVTSAIAKLAKDESNLQVLVSEMSGVWQNIAEFVQKLKLIQVIMIMVGGSILVNLFTAFMVFQSNQGIQSLVKFLVGSGK